MLRASLVACVVVSLAGCGPKVPQHNGYRTKAPWKKAKHVTLDEKNEAKARGDLDYADKDRAQWYALDLPQHGDLKLALQFTPTDDAGDATVAMEVLDSGFRVISEDEDAPLEAPKAAAEDEEDDDEDDEEEDSGETQKDRAVPSLAPGTYYVHLFVTGRTDSADYDLAIAFAPTAKPHESDFPAQVAFVPSLPIVPPEDDAPAAPVKKVKKRGGTRTPPKPEPEDTGAAPVSAIVIDAKASSGGTDITVNAGTDAGLAAGRKGTLAGVKNGGFTLSSCGNRTCKATVKASIDEVNRSSMKVTFK